MTSELSVYPATVHVWLATVWPAVQQVPLLWHAGAQTGIFSGSWPFWSVYFPQGPAVPQQEPVTPPHVVLELCKFSWFVEVLHITSPYVMLATVIGWGVGVSWSLT